MTTGRINQVAFLRDVGTAWASTSRAGNEESKTMHERRTYRGTKRIAPNERVHGPTPTKLSAALSTIKRRCTEEATSN